MSSSLLKEIRQCTACEPHLSHGANPVIQAHPNARLLIIGQAPGIKVHESSIPWNDASGERLREWLGIDSDTFYDEKKVAIVPMSFCYPGKEKVATSLQDQNVLSCGIRKYCNHYPISK